MRYLPSFTDLDLKVLRMRYTQKIPNSYIRAILGRDHNIPMENLNITEITNKLKQRIISWRKTGYTYVKIKKLFMQMYGIKLSQIVLWRTFNIAGLVKVYERNPLKTLKYNPLKIQHNIIYEKILCLFAENFLNS